ncbi:M20/M25/M40 family metallo-hydrolase [Legionella sp. CNM-4043-24]|uniref:M20/M25/M40 family metallo-hydrolase n=1 Tax=Legionella sp. CNM-4043-24 TaxID=3421646 RepID=UPI00403AA212
MKKWVCPFIFLLLVLNQSVSAASIEQQLVHYTQSTLQEQIALLEKLVNINSGTENIAGIHQVGNLLRPQFESLGFKTWWVEEPPQFHRAGTLVAERKGNHGKRVLLIGHLDTVFPAASPFQRFERKAGNMAKGPGVIDDKGGDVVILYALKALQAAHALDGASITVVLTGDEEDSGKPASISRKPLFDAAAHSDVALDFECAITMDTATIARRGITDWTIKTQGQESHSSLVFKKVAGYGAIYELARILDTMRVELARERYLSFNPGIIMGGTNVNFEPSKAKGAVFGKENIIAKTALAKGDLRYLSNEQKLRAEKRFNAIVKQNLPGTTASITYQDGIPGMAPTRANLNLLNEYSRASVRLGYGPVKPLTPGLRGAGDVSYVASMVSASLAGLGPLGVGAHSAQETLDLSSLPIQTQRAAMLIYLLTSAA